MRALVSVWDKSGLVQLADGLVGLGWELLASGGSAAALESAGLPHRPVEDVTGWPEMLGGRVKTLHPAIHGGILADRDRPEHREDLERSGIEPIDLVVCNLYPFATEPGIELIDVGGPTMVRAAAKNFAHVGVLVDPEQYPDVLAELRERGSLSAETRRRLARAAFAHVAAYDANIVSWFDSGGAGGATESLPDTLHITLRRAQELRYGENPHQRGARYAESGRRGWWDGMRQHSGMALSYLNLFDAEAAWQLVWEVLDLDGGAASVVVKHANPCGVAIADVGAHAVADAFDCDPTSAFGGIIAVTSEVGPDVAAALVAGPQVDVVVAPSYAEGTVEALRAKRRNTRVLEAPLPVRPVRELRALDGGFLVQEADLHPSRRASWEVVTKAEPTEEQWRDLELAWLVCARTSSNAIVLASGGRAVGIGAGQPNRVDAARIAATKAGGRAVHGAAASDAFFPFRDGLDAVADSGVGAVAQPGGSVRDAEVVAAADERGLAMVFTGERHFHH